MKTVYFCFNLRRLLLSNVMIVSHITYSVCAKSTAHDVPVLAIFRAATATVMLLHLERESLEPRVFSSGPVRGVVIIRANLIGH